MLVAIALVGAPLAAVVIGPSAASATPPQAPLVVPASTSQPFQPSAVIFKSDGTQAYAVDSNNDQLDVIDSSTDALDSVTPTIRLNPQSTFTGSNPVAITLSPDGKKAYVAEHQGERIAIVDTATNTVEPSVNNFVLSDEPVSVTVNPAGTQLWVGLQGGQLDIVNLATGAVTLQQDVCQNRCYWITFSPDGRFAYLADAGGGIYVWGAQAPVGPIATYPTASAPTGIILDPGNGQYLYVPVGKGIEKIAVDSNGQLSHASTIPLSNFAEGIAIDSTGSRMYVGEMVPDADPNSVNPDYGVVVEVDPSTGSVSGSGSPAVTPTAVAGIALSANGKKMYLFDSRDSALPNGGISVLTAAHHTFARMPAAVIGHSFQFTIPEVGYPLPAFAVVAGSLPPGLTLDPVAGTISGTPTTSGEWGFTVRASGLFPSDQVTYVDGVSTAQVAAATPTSQQKAIAFVEAMYSDVLARTASAGETSGWAAQLLAGASPVAIAGGFVNSDEYRLLRINAAYRNVLGRTATSQEALGWLGGMHSGALQTDDVDKIFYESQEYFNRSGPTGAATATNETYVNSLYVDLIGRSASASEQSGWGSVVQSQGKALVVNAIWNAVETARSRVAIMYQAYLGRVPGPGEVDGWARIAIASGDAQVRWDIIGSQEYLNAAWVRFPN